MNKQKVLNDIGFILNRVSSQLGFVEGHNMRCFSWGYDEIVTSQINVRQFEGTFRLVVFLVRRISFIEELWEDFSGVLNIPNIKHSTFTLPSVYCFPELTEQTYSHEKSPWIKFSISESGLKEFESVLSFLIRDKLIPEANELLDLKILDNEVNGSVEVAPDLTQYIFNSDGFLFRRIILAYLTNNPLFDDICKYHESFFDQYKELSKSPGYEYFENIPDVYDKVIERLKEIEPLDTPVLETK
ncbi:hypothetical protein [Fulvivirga sediminis]|uniref:Uncharacterized protein n=1 Tax=Fulvivirga sediminis TaxID=2803949 RepID=A0A937K2W0_9BACT|nr:hypothetical protein [Fulvivirga sediminis]MBL3658272.1 hypothetical protein [Fulvivirga sediminis]